uniref:protocadherin Fat 4 n=1 Tax=Scatophagus argus TaxID=75038 RepID=UPI001ED8484C|nr:protocadherin Fat 4 [Scatophagus argus]
MAFSKTVYSFEVKEDTVPGTVVGKVETVFETLTPITYSVQEDDGENLFLLSPLSGEFLLSRSLDFEAQSFYVLTVVVQQGGSQVSSVRVYFNVLDVNDNPPVFSQDTLSATLLEDTWVGACFLALNVSDKDDGENGDLKLRVVGGDEEEVFFINPSGSLCLNTELDRERQPFYNLTVTANDCVHPVSLRFTTTACVFVVVDDVNDNPPVFVSTKIFSLPEDTALHSVIMTVHAEDEDAGYNGEVLYYLSNTSGGIFSIDNRSGKIYLEEELDREQEETLTITVTATDKGSPRMTTTMNITVHVEDANDHDPEFPQSTYNLTISEDIPRGTSLLRVQALDRDVGTNGQVRYTLTQASPFVVDMVRGVVTVMDKLDREKDSNYTLIMTAVDQGDKPRSATATINVSVLDVNDFAPVFTPTTVSLHVRENEEDPSQLTYQVSALDEDLGINSQLTYYIQKGNSDGLFSITPSGMLQILQSLDRERESLYFFTIVAVDSGLPPLTGTLTVHVIVDDVNDNRPQFTEEVYNTIVSEDSPVGTVFAMMTAFDIDEGVSGEIRYSMENFDVPFAIDETSGELFTTDVLDRETVAIYRLMVIASDKHPTWPLSSAVLVTVLIGDINDHWPQFMNSPYVAYVPSELGPGSAVCAVRATDGDTEMNAELQYSLYGQSSDLFSISPYSGTIFTSVALQRTEDIIINVHVEDAGENPKFDITTISIRFQNISEFPQMNVDVLKYTLTEDVPVGTLVAVVSAVSIRAEPVSFYLASGNFEDMFHVEQLTGALIVENPLDYENIKEFTLLMEARDSGSPPFSSFAEIHLNITDVNDNYPHFTQVEYRCEVFENSPPSWVCDVLAIDADSASYSTVQYNIIEGNTNHVFTIDPENGLLSTITSLDREDIFEFNLTVEAAELNNPLHKDRATVIVIVLDRNDNAPRFSHIFVTEVPEDSPVGHTITQVTSTDDDTGDNAVIHYSITDQSDDMPFIIDSATGYICVERPLDRETRDHYILKINANDSAWSISTDVTIVILDVNDNRPVFSDHSYTIFLPETKDKEAFVMQVFATDADMGQNREILYVTEPPSEVFWVNASSGEIFTKQPLMLHGSAFELYQFTVIAFDCGNVPLHSSATVTVRLEPYNYYPPIFLPFQPLIAIPYHMAVGTVVVQFTAVDQDVNNSSVGIEYVLNGGNTSDFFQIQADNGKVMLYQSVEESINLFFTLLVLAKDQGTPFLSSQTEITFEITGKNQFSPSFGEPTVTFSVPEDLSVASVIGKIKAEDRDYGPNGAIMYCFTPENQYLPFSVGEASGLLTLIRELDFETESIYHFQIKAVDGGWVSKTGVLNVTVVVMDVNDNPPVFSSSEYTASVLENSDIGTRVLDVKAVDADSGANAQIFYSLVAGHVDKFAIDSRNGTITTLDVFDYEREQIFDITIRASNTGGHALFSLAHVVIQISGVNEFTPKFRTKQFNFLVFKNVPVGSRIGKVTATDDDLGSEGQVFYLMFGQNKYVGFEINKFSGVIYTTGSLRKQGNNHIVLKVLAKNSGIITGMDVDETLVHISVIDMNDAPIFNSALYVTQVTEDSPVGTSVITVSALDHDSVLDWNNFFFSIENGNANVSFAIDPSSGVISVNSQLDRELLPFYNLTVTATDNGSPPATGTTNVVVTIDDINDNAPELTFTEAQVRENQPQGTIVAKLTASDSDLPPNQGPFTYWLVNPSMDTAFSLTPDGVLFTTQTIDREHISAYRVLVAIRDAGIPLLSSTTMIHIEVVDENDNPSFPRNIFIEVKYFGSSFQGGIIGNVRPEDQDVSDTFNCAIKSGPPNMFTVANDTCELWSSPFQGEATLNVTVEATDQVHFPVNNSIYVNYKGFTNASIDSCIFFYVSSSSMEEFLSNKYLRFVKALDSLFNMQASKTHVFGIKHIGREILLLAAVKNYNGQYLSREVASGISAGHRKLLEAQSNVTISHITSDPCLTSACQNGATCNKNIYISQDVAVLESTAVIFVSPRKEVFNCTCPVGFTGTLCEDDINECEVNPCENQGTCVNTPGGFYCHCQSGFSGIFCSTDVDECLKLKCQNGGTCTPTKDGTHCQCVSGFEGEMCEQLVDHCRSTPCVQGRCINSQAGFTCNCPFGVSGLFCEEHSYGFEELSFIEFPPLDRRTNLISLEFATVQRSSLLLYNPGGLSSREFFALEILDGAIHVSYDLGSGPVRLQTKKQVADGYFHSVTARRIGNMGSLHVDNCTDVENTGFCFSQSDGRGSERTLDVGSNMTFGGLRTFESILLHPGQIKTHDFIGCIRNIHVNGILLRPSMALATFNILDWCPRQTPSPCHINPCKNSGTCHDLWSDYVCECKTPFTGSNCTKGVSEELVLRFNGNDYIEYVIKERVKRDYLLKNLLGDEKEENTRDQTVINIKFKTKDNGVLIFVVKQTGYIMLKINDRKPVYISKDMLSGHLSEFTVDSPVADGDWHVLLLFSNGRSSYLLLDGKPALNFTDPSLDLTPVSVEKIIIGAALSGDSKFQHSGFTGCVQYFNVTGFALPVSGRSVMVDVWQSSTLVQSSCSSPGVCIPSHCSGEYTAGRGCLSAHCQNWWRCGLAVQNKSCICLHNVSDHACDICVLPTQSRDRCSEAQGSMTLWLIAVVFPLIFILVIIGMLVALYRVKHQNAKCKSDSSSQRTEQGTDNAAFCFDDSRTLRGAASAEKETQDDPMSADERILSVEFYCDASLSSAQPVPNSELEYYEICSISSASYSDTASLQLSWHRSLYATKCVKTEPKRWGDLKMLLAGLKKESTSKQREISPTKPQNVASLDKQLMGKTDAEQLQHSPPPYKKRCLQPEFLEPVQCLTFEEISKLNAPLEQTMSHQASLKPGSAKCTTAINVSSHSETDSTFTGMESECGWFSTISAKKYIREQSSLSGCSFRQQAIWPVGSCLPHTSQSAAGQYEVKSAPSSMFAQWENILNMHLPFSSYAPVFEDIACLPSESTHSYDMQSDIEEII